MPGAGDNSQGPSLRRLQVLGGRHQRGPWRRHVYPVVHSRQELLGYCWGAGVWRRPGRRGGGTGKVSLEKSTAFEDDHLCGLKQMIYSLCASVSSFGKWDNSYTFCHRLVWRINQGAREAVGRAPCPQDVLAGCHYYNYRVVVGRLCWGVTFELP